METRASPTNRFHFDQEIHMKRRDFMAAMAATTLIASGVAFAAPTHIEVYKSPTCGCCGKWAEHLRENGFAVTVNEVSDACGFRAKAGVPAALASCHTALVEGY